MHAVDIGVYFLLKEKKDNLEGVQMFGPRPLLNDSKKTRLQLWHEEKKRICEIQKENPTWTQIKVSQYASRELKRISTLVRKL